MRVAGPLLTLLGGAALVPGLALHFQDRGFHGWITPALFGAGFLLISGGFALTLRTRGNLSRASTAFNLHLTLLLLTAGSLAAWLSNGGDADIAAMGALIVGAQTATGFLLLIMGAFGEQPRGLAFGFSSILFLVGFVAALLLTIKGLT